MEKSEMGLNQLKKDYQKFEKKYNLPAFEILNDNFEIEKIQDRETDFLIRNIRREVMERIATYMRFLETLMNPSAAPYLFMALASSVTESEKKKINESYLKLGKYFMKSIELDNNGKEEDEAKFIKELVGEWEEIRNEFASLLKTFEKVWENKRENKEKGYIC